MPWWITATLVLLVLVVALDRLLLAAERRGWIYWRRSPPHRATAGHAMQSIEAIFRPEVQHVVEQRAAIDAEDDEDGEPPDPPPPTPHARVGSGRGDDGEGE